MSKLSAAATSLTIGNSPTSAFGTPIWFESSQGGGINAVNAFFASPLAVTENARPKLFTGSGISSPLLAEMDRKVDDGNPTTGIFRFSNPSITGIQAIALASCVAGNTAAIPAATWVVSPVGQCAGVSLF
jgi:hypothetical protein